MSSVDNRIVNMQFNNKQFVQGAAESQKSLTDLEKKIASTGKGPGLSSMGSAVDQVSHKFSAMQVAGVAALGTIVSKATSAGLSMLKSFTIDPLVDGFREYQTNLESIQTVMANTGANVNTVNAYMQKLNTYSDQTIYNFSEMAKNIGTFTAAGVKLGTATSAIQGIANVAALSGSNSQQASTAMYQLSQAIASGKVGLQDWNSVVNAGMGGKVFQTALAQTGVAMGTIGEGALKLGDKLTIGGKSFRESISAVGGGPAWLTGDVLTKTLSLLDGRLSATALGMQTLTQEQIKSALAGEKVKLQAQGLSKEQVKSALATEQQRLAVEGYSDAQIKGLLATQKRKLVEEGYNKEQISGMLKTADAAYKAATQIRSFPQLMQVVKEGIGSVFANSFSLILGNFNQSTELWGAVGDKIIGPTGFLTKITGGWNSMLKDWANADGDQASGRWKVFSALGRIASSLGKVFGALSQAYHDVFPPSTTNILRTISVAFNHFSKNLVVGADGAEKLRSIFGGVFAVLHIGITIIKSVFSVMSSLFGLIFHSTGPASGGILSMAAAVGDAIMAFDKWFSSGDKLKGLIGLLSPLLKTVGKVISSIDFGAGFSGIVDSLKSVSGVNASGPLNAIGTALEFVKTKVDAFLSSGSVLAKGITGLGDVAGMVSNVLSGAAGIGQNVILGLVSGLTGASTDAIKTAISDIGNSIVEWFKSTLGIHSPATELVPIGVNIIMGVVEGIGQAFSALGAAISAVGKFIGDLFSNLFSGLDAKGAASGLMDFFKQMFGGMDSLDIANLMNAIFSGAIILTMNNLLKATGGFTQIGPKIAETFGQLTDTLKTMQGSLRAKMLLDIALSVGILVASIIALSFIDPGKIAVSIGAIGLMMTMLTQTFKQLSKIQSETNIAVLAASILLVSFAMLNLAVAIAAFGNMDLGTLAKGFGAIAIGLNLMTATMTRMAGISGSLIAAGVSIFIIATAMTALAAAVLAFGSMDMSTLAKGLGAMAIGLKLITSSLETLGNDSKGVLAGAAAIVLVSGALLVLSAAVAAFGNMDLGTLAKGFGAVAVALIIFVVALNALAVNAQGVLAAGAAMLMMATALAILVPVILALGTAPWEVVAKGLAFVAAALGILLLAGLAAMYIAPGLLALGITIGLIGAAMFLAGAGMLAFATGFAILTVVGVAGIALLVVAFHVFMALLPTFAIQIAAAMVSFVEAIAAAAPRLRKAFSTIFESMLGVVKDAIPVIGDLLQQLIDTGIRVIKKSVPRWVEMGFTIIDKFLDSAEKHIPAIADSVGNLIVNFLNSLTRNLPRIIEAGTNLIIAFIEGLGNAAVQIADATGQTILDFLHGIDAAIVKYSSDIRAAGVSIAGHLIDGLAGGLPSKIAGAIRSAFSQAKGMVGNTIGKFLGRARPLDLNQIGAAVSAAYANANATANNALARGDRNLLNLASTASQAAQGASTAGGKASGYSATADAAAAEAEKLRNKADKKGSSQKSKNKAKKAEKTANKLQNKADRAANAATRAQERADTAAKNLEVAASVRDADNSKDKADIMSGRAVELATQANDALSKANAEAALATEMKKKGKKGWEDILKQSQADAAVANDLARQAADANASAVKYYADARAEANKEVTDRITDIEQRIRLDQQARDDAAAYEKADDQGKLAIMTARAEASETAAATAKDAALALIERARAMADSDHDGAMLLLDQAEAQAQIASEAADRAETERDTVKELTEKINGPQSGTGSTITPSKSVLEDAASVFDRYTKSMAEATAAAEATPSVVQYTQNNYSPEALSPSVIYRQGKNLVAAHELKMAGNP